MLRVQLKRYKEEGAEKECFVFVNRLWGKFLKAGVCVFPQVEEHLYPSNQLSLDFRGRAIHGYFFTQTCAFV